MASADLRTHTASGNVAGSGFGVNNFAAIYTKNFPACANTGVLKATANGGIDFYGVAVMPVPEPTTLMLAVLGVCGGAMLAYRRRSM